MLEQKFKVSVADVEYIRSRIPMISPMAASRKLRVFAVLIRDGLGLCGINYGARRLRSTTFIAAVFSCFRGRRYVPDVYNLLVRLLCFSERRESPLYMLSMLLPFSRRRVAKYGLSG